MARQMTKVERYQILKGYAQEHNDADSIAFIDHEVELIEKKNKAERGPTVNQVENKEIKNTS